jgi:hypothetical protein
MTLSPISRMGTSMDDGWRRTSFRAAHDELIRHDVPGS